MNNKYLWLLAALVGSLMVLPGISCGDDDNNNPTDDGGADIRDDSGGGDTGETCPPTSFSGGVVEMRLRRLNVTSPPAMDNVVLQQLITDSLDRELFIWLLRFDGIGSGTLNLQTGSGEKVPGTTCTYQYLAPTYPPDSMTMTETGSAVELSGDPIAQLDVPMWSEGTAFPEPPLLTLPLRELDISGTFSADHLTIGTYDPIGEEWTDGGLLVGKITVDDAKATVIDALDMTLCGLIANESNAAGPSDDCTGDPTTWTNPPDTTVGTAPAYNLQGTISASVVYINE
jgi:hypothetical protein